MNKLYRKAHKWLGIGIGLIVIFFSVTGIILNHRQAIAGLDISRTSLPKHYQISNYNNGIVRGTLAMDHHQLMVWGNAGVWLSDSHFSFFKSMNAGLPEGADHRDMLSVVRTSQGMLLAASSWGVYRWEGRWKSLYEAPIRDMTIHNDTLVMVTDTAILTSAYPYRHVRSHAIKNPHKKGRASLFSFVMKLHSGELFGWPGILVVDGIAFVFCILVVTGFFFTFGGKKIRKPALRWHNALGLWLIVFTLGITLTGLALRDPLSGMIRKITYTTHSANLQDLRAIRWNAHAKKWMLVTKRSMYWLDTLAGKPKKMKAHPQLTAMGVNVFESIDSLTWVVGSLRGTYQFRPEQGDVKAMGHRVAALGFSQDLTPHRLVVFEKRKGLVDMQGRKIKNGIGKTPQVLKKQGMPLWNIALEIHVGRFFMSWIPGLSSALYVGITGVIILVVLLTGLWIHPKVIRSFSSLRR